MFSLVTSTEFVVNDIDAFVDTLESYDIEVDINHDPEDNVVTMVFKDTFFDSYFNENGDECAFTDIIADHLASGAIAVFHMIGQSATGDLIARIIGVNSDGEVYDKNFEAYTSEVYDTLGMI